VIPGKALELPLPQLPCLEIKSSFLRNFLDIGLEVQQIIHLFILLDVYQRERKFKEHMLVEEQCEFRLALDN